VGISSLALNSRIGRCGFVVASPRLPTQSTDTVYRHKCEKRFALRHQRGVSKKGFEVPIRLARLARDVKIQFAGQGDKCRMCAEPPRREAFVFRLT
jgi:hypothetical protein